MKNLLLLSTLIMAFGAFAQEKQPLRVEYRMGTSLLADTSTEPLLPRTERRVLAWGVTMLLAGLMNDNVVAMATGHAALHLGLMLAEVGQGDEVITPAFNNRAHFVMLSSPQVYELSNFSNGIMESYNTRKIFSIELMDDKGFEAKKYF